MALLTKQTRHFVADTYLSFIFWTVLTSLGLCIWYFPLWHMGISGYEVLLLSDIAPVLLGIGPLRRLLRHHRGITALMGLVGVFAYAVQDPLQRLVLVAVGSAGVMLSLASVLYEDRVPATGRLDRDIQAWEAGLLPEFGGIFLGVVALLDVVTRRSDAQAEVRDAKKKDLAMPAVKRQEAAWVPAAFGFGALLFALHSMYSDSAIIGRWTWDGYPHSGPQPVPWGGLVLMALAGGFSVGHRIELTTGMLWWGVGSICAGLVTFVSGWSGFVPGLVLAFYLGSITRSILRVLARCPPGRTFFVGILWYNILVLGHVWVVAYEFVPGGPLLRERTWVVMLATMLSLYGALVSRSGDVRHEVAGVQAASVARTDRHRARSVFWACVVAGWAAMFMRFPAATKTPTPHLRDLEVDVMGFLESDTERIIMGGRDWTQRVGEELNYYVDYGPSPRKHTWGCAMISKFPIKNSTHHLLPSPHGELACAIHATLDVHGRDIDVIISHNGQEENPLDRRLQTTELARIMRESQNPFIFTGYVVTKPHAENYKILFDGGRMHDIDPTDHDRWCQYIGYRGVKRVGYARISRGTITDTEIQAGKFVDISGWQPSYARVEESHYPAEYHFPKKFHGKGVRGHFYHVFNAPRYFD
ncbi:hypothetical protein DL89DRAFT_264162 [Linderina pennispora]|uniref:Uncharacterized protein n=1 Tax=Linderina pennispora TaxID=61395 RepID=A0A1Y1WL71_9FUNG|nr:uncharacterized protein DL89DRAFT_264162 [Linderina pennispora]ORX74233.1 hypothetical protein DL89DRAFT_264162 [Linderina pennispora]